MFGYFDTIISEENVNFRPESWVQSETHAHTQNQRTYFLGSNHRLSLCPALIRPSSWPRESKGGLVVALKWLK